MKLLFIRHGETTINEQGKVHSLSDSATLTKKGKQQIRSVIPICTDHLVEYIYCSPEPRAVESAHIISSANHTPVEFLPELRERNWGTWAEKPWGEIKKMLEDKTLEDRYTFVPPEGESWQQLAERLQKALMHIASQKHKSVAIITHGGALRYAFTHTPTIKNKSSI